MGVRQFSGEFDKEKTCYNGWLIIKTFILHSFVQSSLRDKLIKNTRFKYEKRLLLHLYQTLL